MNPTFKESYPVYFEDIAIWAKQQAEFLRSGQFDRLDIEHLADEIEDVGKSEQRELASRMSVLLAHLLKWQFQPERRCRSWERTIVVQRRAIMRHLKEVPSLSTRLDNSEWLDKVWDDAITIAVQETGLSDFPDSLTWQIKEVLGENWLPHD